MLKRFTLVFALGILAAAGVHAQGAPIDLWVTTGVSTFRNKSFSRFAESFNAFNSAVIDKPLNGFALGRATNWGASVVFGDAKDDEKDDIIEFSFFASNLHTKDQVTYTDDTKRVFDVKRHEFGFEMGVGGRIGKLAITGCWGALMGNSILNSYYVYADGTESHGQEKTYNGIFDGFNGTGFLGAKATYRIQSFKLLARLTWGGDLFKKFYFTDHNTARTLNVTQGTWPSELPIDVQAYSTAVANNDTYDGDRVENRFGSFGLQIGIAYSFVR